MGAGVVVALGLVLLFLLTQATGNRELYERNYALLFGLNVAVAGLLLLVIGWMALRLVLRLRQGRFGSRLLVKLAAIFALVGLMPGLMIYVVSYQFVSRSIESWFDVKVEGALAAGLNLGRATLDTLATDLANKTRQAATQLAETPDAMVGLALERLRDQLAASDVVLWSASGQLIASAGESRFLLQPERPIGAATAQRTHPAVTTQIEGLDEVVPGGNGELGADTRAACARRHTAARIKAIAVVQQPESERAGAAALSAGHHSAARRRWWPTPLPCRKPTANTRSGRWRAAACAACTSARSRSACFWRCSARCCWPWFWATSWRARCCCWPKACSRWPQGDLTPKAALQGKDELGGLTRSFADMTQQLADARSAVQHSMSQVDAARANLQTILDNLTAGVIVLDAQGAHPVEQPGRHPHPARAAGRTTRASRWAKCPGWRRLPRTCRPSLPTTSANDAPHGAGPLAAVV